jgi:hypothetical protein
MMDDRRDPSMRDPLDPTMHQMAREDAINQSNTGMGWIAGAVFLVVVLALIFGLGRGDRTATNDTNPPAATTGAAPPAGPATTPRTTTGQGGTGQ